MDYYYLRNNFMYELVIFSIFKAIIIPFLQNHVTLQLLEFQGVLIRRGSYGK